MRVEGRRRVETHVAVVGIGLDLPIDPAFTDLPIRPELPANFDTASGCAEAVTRRTDTV